jgi:hypothetical protein
MHPIQRRDVEPAASQQERWKEKHLPPAALGKPLPPLKGGASLGAAV